MDSSKLYILHVVSLLKFLNKYYAIKRYYLMGKTMHMHTIMCLIHLFWNNKVAAAIQVDSILNKCQLRNVWNEFLSCAMFCQTEPVFSL